MPRCEIIYVKDLKGWKWRAVTGHNAPKRPPSKETFQLYYECVTAARANGYDPNIKCL